MPEKLKHTTSPAQKHAATRTQTGTSLIEVLVAILLVSLGVLGAAGMQTKAISNALDSVQRQTAAALAEDLLELMRADPANTLSAAGTPLANSAYVFSSAMSAAEKTALLPSQNLQCQPFPTQANNRLSCWLYKVQAVMPEVTNDLIAEQFLIEADEATRSWTVRLAWPVQAGQCLQLASDGNAITENAFCTYTIHSIL